LDSETDRRTGNGSGADVCIIGAGSSGLVTAKILKQKGLAFDCFEKGSDIGGMWRYENDNGRQGLYFVGLVQPIGPTIPLVERQAEWLAAVLSGEVTLPARDTMEREIDRHHSELTRRFVGSPRYTLEVDFRSYARELAQDCRERRAGA
jgi:cation diffusion facilitator CzcD-associated flavoprotein CzcO